MELVPTNALGPAKPCVRGATSNHSCDPDLSGEISLMEEGVVKDPRHAKLLLVLNRLTGKVQTPWPHHVAATRASLVSHYCREPGWASFSWRSLPRSSLNPCRQGWSLQLQSHPR